MPKPAPSSESRFSRRHLAVLEDDLAGRLHVPAHLVLVGAEGQAGRIFRHDEGRNALRPVGAGARHDDVEVAVAGARDELLDAVQHIVAAALHRARLQRRRIRSRTRLGQAIARQPFHRGQLRQEVLALLVAAEAVDHRSHHVVDRDEGGEGRIGARKRLEDQHRVEPAERRAADIVTDIDAAKAERAGLADHVCRKMLVAVPVERVRRNAIGGEGLGHLAGWRAGPR